MPLLFQVLVVRVPKAKLVVPEVLSAPAPVIVPLVQLKAPATFKLPLPVSVPPETLSTEFASNADACVSVSEPAVRLTVLVPVLVTVRLLADDAAFTVRVLVPARL